MWFCEGRVCLVCPAAELQNCANWLLRVGCIYRLRDEKRQIRRQTVSRKYTIEHGRYFLQQQYKRTHYVQLWNAQYDVFANYSDYARYSNSKTRLNIDNKKQLQTNRPRCRSPRPLKRVLVSRAWANGYSSQ